VLGCGVRRTGKFLLAETAGFLYRPIIVGLPD
jgi:hypothetical protein